MFVCNQSSFLFARAVSSGISKAVSFVILGFWAVDVDIQPGWTDIRTGE